jgi:hypothetical protein
MDFLERLQGVIVVLRDSVQGCGRVTDEQIKDAGYYRACAAEMMVKAQAAPSSHRAYLNLALKWQALENQNFPGRTEHPSPMAGQ